MLLILKFQNLWINFQNLNICNFLKLYLKYFCIIYYIIYINKNTCAYYLFINIYKSDLSYNSNITGKILTNESLEVCLYEEDDKVCKEKNMACLGDNYVKTCENKTTKTSKKSTKKTSKKHYY